MQWHFCKSTGLVTGSGLASGCKAGKEAVVNIKVKKDAQEVQSRSQFDE